MDNYIKKARLFAGLSQKEVALTLHVSAPTVSEWESGKKNPTLENLICLADLLGVTTDYLLGRDINVPTSGSSVASVSPDEAQLLSDYRVLSTEGKQYILQTVAMVKMTYSEKK